MVIKRLGFGLLTLFAISLLITVGMEFLAGDVCTEMLGQMAQPDTVSACRAELNLDRPVHIRYAEWVWNLLHGDMGVSLANRREVSELISRRIGNTLFLAGMSALGTDTHRFSSAANATPSYHLGSVAGGAQDICDGRRHVVMLVARAGSGSPYPSPSVSAK